GAAAPKPKASARKKKGGSASSTTPPTPIANPTPTTTVVAAPRLSAAAKDVERTEAEQLKIVLRRSRHETHISQQGPSSTDEGIGMESIFTTGSSTVTPIPSPQSTMTPSIISTFTTTSQLPIPPTPIPSLDLQNLPTFALVFRFEDRVKLLEVNFSNIPCIVNQYMHQQMSEVIRKAVQTQTDWLQDSIQRENDEFLKTIDDNMKKIIKEQEGPSAGSDRGSKRQREGGEHASAITPSEQATESAGRSITGTQSRQLSASESAFAEEPVQTTCRMEEPSHPVFETGAEDQPLFYGFAVNREYALDVYSKRRIIAVTELKIVEWHNYKHLDWISVRRDDDKIYKFKEGDLKRLRLQDIEDMLLFLVQGKLSNLTVKERFAFNVSLRMFTRSIVIQRRMKDL
nr:hypothetical protein [Tanacetum cinerariifolium]